MDKVYTIHSNPEHCSVEIEGKIFSFNEVYNQLKLKGRKFIRENIKKSIVPTIEDFYKNFDKINSTELELEEFYKLRKKKDDANRWKSGIRALRKKGKLEQSKIDALNDFGMTWNPKKDEWEIMFELFKSNPIIDILNRLIKKYGLREKKIVSIVHLENWKIEQKKLYKSSSLSNENLRRLKSINFKFEHDRNFKELLDLVICVFNFNFLIDKLGIAGANRNEFINFYNLENEKNYLGSKIKITESQINFKRFNKQIQKNDKIKSSDKKLTTTQRKALNEAKQNSFEFYKKQIDKIAKYKATEQEKNHYGFDTIENLNYNRFGQRRNEILMFLSNDYYSKKYKVYIKYEFEEDVKVYASEKILEILDNYLLPTKKLNARKSFKSLSFLIRYYNKNKNYSDINRLYELVSKHEILKLIYCERLKKILSNKKEPENKLSKDKKENIISEVQNNEDGSKNIKLKREGENDLSLNVNVSFLEKVDKVEDDSRVYDGANKNGFYSYSSVDSEGNKVTGSTSESPKEYALRKKISNTTVNYKGKEYGDKELKQIHFKLSENYVPVYQRQLEAEKEFNPFKELNEEERQKVETWKKKMDASSWKSRQRSLRRQGKLKQYQVDMLNKLGMLWNPTTDLWEKNYSLFKQIGFCDELENWIKEQRKLYSTNKLSNENLYRLQSINFPFEKGENESFPFTWNSYYKLLEKLRKKKEIIQKKESPISKKEEKRNKEYWKKQNKIQKFYYGFGRLEYNFETQLHTLSNQELKLLISNIVSGKSMYYDSYIKFMKEIKESEIYKLVGSQVFNNYKERIKKNIDYSGQFKQLTPFNKKTINAEIRELACKKMLNYYKHLSISNSKTFPPLQYLISSYTKEKKLQNLVELQTFVNSYPLLNEVYMEKIEKSILKLS